MSYAFVVILFSVIVLIPQKNQIIKYKVEKDLLEYNYLRIKNNPSFFKSIENTVETAENLIINFEWLNYSDDPNLLIFQHLENLSKKSGIEIISVKNVDVENELYYIWDIKLVSDFKSFVDFIYLLETDEKFLKVEEIEVFPSEEKDKFFNLKIAGIKKVK
ncbi:MAG: hypothetical protein NC899_04320 [Candidatus Omnitrophica bacterium]|nr:hypothetical protein [Candidatus Omnitrophota bacterium]